MRSATGRPLRLADSITSSAITILCIEAIRIGLFTSPSLDQQFEFIGELGNGHPDPDIGFAEGQFYLINQTKHDYVSPGPWVETVTARVGVDTTNDGNADTWSDWQEVKEQYDHIQGFSKQINAFPRRWI